MPKTGNDSNNSTYFWGKSYARCDFKIWRRLVTRTKSRHESIKWKSTGPPRWGSQSTRWPSSGYYSFTITVCTSSSTGEISSWSRWAPTAYTSGFHVIWWKRRCVLRCWKSSEHATNGTNGASESRAVYAGVRGHSRIALCSKCYFMEDNNEKCSQRKKRWQTSCGRCYERISSLTRGRQLGVDRHDKKLLANEARLRSVVQIMQNRFIGFGDGFFDVIHFQWPDWVCRSFPSTLKLAVLVEIAHNRSGGGKPFFAQANRSVGGSRGME